MPGLMGQVTFKTWIHYKQNYPWAMCTAYAETRMGFVFRLSPIPKTKTHYASVAQDPNPP